MKKNDPHPRGQKMDLLKPFCFVLFCFEFFNDAPPTVVIMIEVEVRPALQTHMYSIRFNIQTHEIPPQS